MTFHRVLPVLKQLKVVLWIVSGTTIIVITSLLIAGASSPSSSQTSKMNPSEVEEKLKNIRAEATNLKDRLNQSSEPRSRSTKTESHLLAEPPRLGAGMADSAGGFQRVASSKNTEVYIPMGSVFRAQLIMPIKTSVQDTFVMAQTTHEYRFDSDQVRSIPSGSRVIGRAQLNPLLKGVAVRFHTLVTPKGIEYPINLIALSNELFAEVNGIYFSNDVETYGAILAFGAIGGFANASQSTDSRFLIAAPNKGTANLVWGSVGGASFRMADELIRKIQERNVEYIVVPSGEKIFLALQERFVIKDKKPIR